MPLANLLLVKVELRSTDTFPVLCSGVGNNMDDYVFLCFELHEKVIHDAHVKKRINKEQIGTSEPDPNEEELYFHGTVQLITSLLSRMQEFLHL